MNKCIAINCPICAAEEKHTSVRRDAERVKITEFSYASVRVVSVYGGRRVEVDYDLQTITEGLKNHYSVVLELRGLDAAEPFFDLMDYKAHTNNEHTLTKEAVGDLITKT